MHVANVRANASATGLLSTGLEQLQHAELMMILILQNQDRSRRTYRRHALPCRAKTLHMVVIPDSAGANWGKKIKEME